MKLFVCKCLIIIGILLIGSFSYIGAADKIEFNEGESNLFQDLLIVDYWNRRLNDRMPVTYDHFLGGGYFNMPSARMGEDGEIGGGYSSVPPYRNYNLRIQLTDRIEISGSYRIFKGVEDPILSPLGFGDMSDKGVNLKFALFHAEDSRYTLPGLAIGFQDFLGTKNFLAKYVVATQVFLEQNLEVSLGYGTQRIRGFFGGVLWMPFRRTNFSLLKGLSLAAEYDATPYTDPAVEKHPKGRQKKSPINYGIKYRLWDTFDFTLSYVRGHALAVSASTYYNFGTTEGFLPKIDDALLYQAPVNLEPLGELRPPNAMMQDLVYAFREQGFELLQGWLSYDKNAQKTLRIKMVNSAYRLMCEVEERLNYLLSRLIPSDIDFVIVVIESDGFPVQEYHYTTEFLRKFNDLEIGPYELEILTPICEVTAPDPAASLIFDKRREWLNIELLPKTHTFFGSSRGKFKYALGLHAGFNGFLSGDWYYSILLGYIFLTNLDEVRGIDRLNPSQLINVRTDVVRYFNQRGITVDEAYLQKNWNMGCGWFSRVALGYFEEEYGGAAGEFLYYPVESHWAFGIDGAILKKRTISGLGFTNKVRKLDGFRVTHRKFLGSQYFLDLYYKFPGLSIDAKIKIGKFLANDYGARFEVSRKYESGLQVSIWYTWTNGNDRLNGQTYHDKGVAFSMPLDIFYTHSDRDMWNYGLSAWLRDVGVVAITGYDLYYLIKQERE